MSPLKVCDLTAKQETRDSCVCGKGSKQDGKEHVKLKTAAGYYRQ